jgi:hypothetical protein
VLAIPGIASGRIGRPAGPIVVALLALALSASPVLAVIGGEVDGTRHPYVGAHDAGGPCGRGFGSGVLVSPTVYVMSGHGAHFCLDRGITRMRVTFDPVIDPAGTYHEGTIHGHPDYAGQSKENDVAVIVFDEPIVGIAPARLPPAGLLDDLGPGGLRGRTFTVVGYGISRIIGGPYGSGQPHVDGASGGTRKLLHETFLSVARDKLRLLMHEDGQTCAGDSGSPALFAGTDLIAGLSVGGDGFCANMDEHQRLDTPAVRDFLDQFLDPTPN